MLPTFGQRLEQGARHLLPVLTALLFVLSSAIAWPLPFIGAVAPSLGLVAVYYWAIYRPDLFRPTFVFFLGLLNDALNFLPLGLTALVFVGVHHLALSQRRFFVGQIFFMLWSGFVIVDFLTMFVNWTVVSLLNGHAVSFMPVFLQALLTAVFFPLPAWVLIRLQRAFLSQS